MTMQEPRASTQTRFRVEGMDCAACATKIDTAVRRLPGVDDVNVSVTAGTMTVRHGDALALDGVIEAKVRSLGYRAVPVGVAAAASASEQAHTHGPGCSGHDHAHEHSTHTHVEEDHGHAHAHLHETGSNTRASKPPSGLHGHDHSIESGPWWASAKGRLTLASALGLAVAWLAGKLLPDLANWAFIAAMLIGLVPIGRRAVMAALNGMPFTIETLLTVAALGAVAIGAGEEAATVVVLFLVGELLEGVAAGRARASIKSLSTLVPQRALLEENGQVREVAADTLPVGATILVRPGDRISADGEILSGASSINEAPVTGESTPVSKSVGDKVFAGTVNGEAALRVRVSVPASDNTIARVVRLIEEAQEAKAPTERFIDRFSRYYTPAVLLAGALVAVVPPLAAGASWSEWIYKGCAILLIGCPCALVISTPAAIASALSAGARQGLLVKGGGVLEQLRKVNRVAFDKTGTLTAGKLTVTDVVPLGRTTDEVVALAAALEVGSSHPLALAILGEAAQRNLTIEGASDAAAIGGKGVTGQVGDAALFLGSARAAAGRATLPEDLNGTIDALSREGKSVSILLNDKQVVGLIALQDQPRPDAAAGLAALKQSGIACTMLTGDNRQAAAAVAGQLGIEVESELMPEDKQRIVKGWQSAGQTVAQVGDGINDAPALAAADIGIAMGGGTDVALETADAAILHGRVGDVASLVELSRRTMGNIHQNIGIALGLKLVFLVTTIAGLTGLWPAILADTGATVLVTLNAMRLLGWKGHQAVES